MPGRNPKSLDWKQRFVLQMRRDKKKAAVLVVLVLVGLIIFGRMLLKTVGPAKAKGAPAAAAGPISHSPASPRGIGQKKKSPTRPAGRSPGSENGSTPRDLFVADLRCYPKVEPVDKPKDKQPDALRQTEDPEAIIRAKAKSLALQSTMVGWESSAMINGQVLRVGEWIDGFRVVEIHARSCIVECEGIRVPLDMKKN